VNLSAKPRGEDGEQALMLWKGKGKRMLEVES